MAKPFTRGHVFVFLLLCALALLAVYGLFEWTTHSRGHQSIQSTGPPAI